MSLNFGGKVDVKHLPFPSTMRIDYVRVYQRSDQKNVGCDPKDFPTQAYINQYVKLISPHAVLIQAIWCRYIETYTNPNLTTWRDDYVSFVYGSLRTSKLTRGLWTGPAVPKEQFPQAVLTWFHLHLLSWLDVTSFVSYRNRFLSFGHTNTNDRIYRIHVLYCSDMQCR